MTPDDLTRNFRTKVTICECDGCRGYDRGPCWLFARTDRYGYSQFKFNGRELIGHRFAYERLVGAVPEDHDIDHLCDRHRNCVNPGHMEPTTKSENARRANARRWGKAKQDSFSENEPHSATESTDQGEPT